MEDLTVIQIEWVAISDLIYWHEGCYLNSIWNGINVELLIAVYSFQPSYAHLHHVNILEPDNQLLKIIGVKKSPNEKLLFISTHLPFTLACPQIGTISTCPNRNFSLAAFQMINIKAMKSDINFSSQAVTKYETLSIID